jgi:hypothetical protein
MTLDLTALTQPLALARASDLESADERLEAIDRFAEKEDFAAAASAVAELCAEGVYDIRCLPYWLYQAFRERGFVGTLEGLSLLETLLGPSLARLGPERRKDEYINRRVAWLFEKIGAAIAYHDKYQTAEWQSLKASRSSDVVERTIASGERLAGLLGGKGDASRALAQLLSQLRAQAELVAPAEPVAAAIAGAPSPTSTHELRLSEREGLTRMELLVAPPFLALCRKLQAFEQLASRQELRKAAVVADEIASVIEAFDPLLYFPELFSRYAALLSKHARELSELEPERETASWRALARHARVDLTGFVEG